MFTKDDGTTILMANTNGSLTVPTNITAGGFLAMKAQAIDPEYPAANEAQIYAKEVSGPVTEIFVQSSDHVITQISPHADDAPAALYDPSVDMKEMIWREESPYMTNGRVSFINARRMAKLTELNTKAILFLAGQTSAGNSNALQKLKGMSNAERQVIMNETFAEYNARTGKNKQPRNWEADQAALQAKYDAARATAIQERDWLTQTNASITASLVTWSNQVATVTVSNVVLQAQIDAGATNVVLLPLPVQPNTNLVALPEIPPLKDVRRPKPAWLQ